MNPESPRSDSRRKFLKLNAALSAGSAWYFLSGTSSTGQVRGANERVNTATVGIKGRGGSHIDGFLADDNAQVVALIDVDATQFKGRQAKIRDKQGGKDVKTYADIRGALEDKDIDAISVATCNHTHSLNTVWACQAGKHVYVEKPMSHNVWEGRKCIEAAEKYGVLVQHGTQQRSSESRAKEIAAVKSGNYGKLTVSKGYCCKPRWSIGFKEVEPVPDWLNWDAWVGPAPMQDFHRNLVHYNWHWFWDFGNGDTGNQGVHEIDVARWAIEGATMPERVWALGGRLGYEDQGQTPNMHMSIFDYGDALVVFETRGLVANKGKAPGWDFKVKNEYYTTDGMIAGGKFYPKGSDKGESIKGGVPDKITPGGPFGSFITAIREGDKTMINAPVEHGHFSSALCHLGNIAMRVGEEVPFSEKPKHLGDNPQVAESWDQISSNLEGAGVDLGMTNYQIGPVLEIDQANERFTNNDEANKLLSRDYREGWAIPNEV
ncbi:MAG: putative dehydrogenase [Verrucomicrobiales bacterium]|jgi:predicted dehydrogenase